LVEKHNQHFLENRIVLSVDSNRNYLCIVAPIKRILIAGIYIRKIVYNQWDVRDVLVHLVRILEAEVVVGWLLWLEKFLLAVGWLLWLEEVVLFLLVVGSVVTVVSVGCVGTVVFGFPGQVTKCS